MFVSKKSGEWSKSGEWMPVGIDGNILPNGYTSWIIPWNSRIKYLKIQLSQ
jgi:hypothetical protein